MIKIIFVRSGESVFSTQANRCVRNSFFHVVKSIHQLWIYDDLTIDANCNDLPVHMLIGSQSSTDSPKRKNCQKSHQFKTKKYQKMILCAVIWWVEKMRPFINDIMICFGSFQQATLTNLRQFIYPALLLHNYFIWVQHIQSFAALTQKQMTNPQSNRIPKWLIMCSTRNTISILQFMRNDVINHVQFKRCWIIKYVRIFVWILKTCAGAIISFRRLGF